MKRTLPLSRSWSKNRSKSFVFNSATTIIEVVFGDFLYKQSWSWSLGYKSSIYDMDGLFDIKTGTFKVK